MLASNGSRWREQLFSETPLAPVAPMRSAGVRVPCLTVLWHPDPALVGWRSVLRRLAAGREVALSRLEPEFLGAGEAPPRPLADPFLSRRPLLLRPAKNGQIELATAGSPSFLVVDGTAVHGERLLSPADLERGAVLLIADRVALLLHLSEPGIRLGGADFGLVGESLAIAEVRREISRLAEVEVPVLLRGETGTGKELVARAIHGSSRRHDRPYVAVNLAAIPPTLAAAELFGAAKGSFTGAEKRQLGYFARADSGTLFLDEIGDVPLDVQALLLRALETGEVQAVGGGLPQRLDVRLIAATDSDLETKVKTGDLRGPLLHRLSSYEITLPPLRARREDLGSLLLHFLGSELRRLGQDELLHEPPPGQPPWLGAPLVARLAGYDWPGNVRQLRNVAQQLAIANRGEPQAQMTAPLERLLAEIRAPPTASEQRGPHRKPSEVGEAELLATLRAHAFELKATARALGISRPALYLLVERCPRVRKAGELERPEIEPALERSAGDLEAAALTLEVSHEGLRQRMRALGLPTAPDGRS